jgi:hypothetical protein
MPQGIQPIVIVLKYDRPIATMWFGRGRRNCIDNSTCRTFPSCGLIPLNAVIWRFELNNRIFVHRASTALQVINRCSGKKVHMPARLHLSQFIEHTSDEGSPCH